jgi:hypothetical protein
MSQPCTSCCCPASVIDALVALLTADSPEGARAEVPPATNELPPLFLREPHLEVRSDPDGGGVHLGKADFQLFDGAVRPDAPFLIVGRFATPAEAEAAKANTPHLRLAKRIEYHMKEDGLEKVLEGDGPDWRNDPDAKRVGERLNELAALLPAWQQLPDPTRARLVLARLRPGDLALHRPHPDDPTKSVILIDPFQLEHGILGLAALVAHELTHARQYQDRGFPIEALPHALPPDDPDDFVLVRLEDELAGVTTEVAVIEQALAAAPASIRGAAKRFVQQYTEAPAAYFFPPEGAPESPEILTRAAREAVAEVYAEAAEDAFATLRAQPRTHQTEVAAWLTSAEWRRIQATRSSWKEVRTAP